MKNHLDNSVYFVFGATWLIALIVILFSSASTPLPPVRFSVEPDTAFVGDTIKFSDQTIGSTSRTWNFGDSQKDTPLIASHVYLRSDTFHGSLVVNGKDTSFVVFIVGKKPFDPCPSYHRPRVNIPKDVTYVNTKILFEDMNDDDTARVWDFNDGYTSHKSVELHSFKTPGKRWVKLKVFGGCIKPDIDSFLISVIPPPPSLNAIIRTQLNNNIMQKKKDPKFEPPLRSLNIVLEENGTLTSFKKFYKKALEKQLYIQSLTVEADDNYINRITLHYK